MFSFFKKKKREQPQESTPEELEQMAVGDKMLERLGDSWDYLMNVSTLLTSRANEIPLLHIYGHIHTCIKLGAPAVVSNLAQLAAYRLQEYDDDPDINRHIKEFEQLAMQRAMDAVSYMKSNGKELVYC